MLAALIVSLAAGLWPQHAQAQQLFTANLNEFPEEVRTKLEAINNNDTEKFAKFFAEEFWPLLDNTAKKNIIRVSNELLKRKMLVYPHLMQFWLTCVELKNDTNTVRIQYDDFFALTDSMLKYTDAPQTLKFHNTLRDFVPEAIIYKTGYFSWRFTQTEPELTFLIAPDTLTGKTAYYPAFVFSGTKLVYQTKDDTAAIKHLYGTLNLVTKRLKVESARYDWERWGMDPDDIYVDMQKFEMNLNLNSFYVDSVTFTYKSFLPKTLVGNLTETMEFKFNPEDANYPYFQSLEGGIVINNFIENVTYSGGFSMRGVTKIGSRTEKEPAMLDIRNPKKQRILILKADEFALNPRLLITADAEVTVFLPEGDTLYHPSMQLEYDVVKRHMTLKKNRKNPFSTQGMLSSYHNMNFYFKSLFWYTDQDTITFGSVIDAENENYAVESYDYYNYQRYYNLRGILKFHPATVLYLTIVEAKAKFPTFDYKKDWFPMSYMISLFDIKDDPEAIHYVLQNLEYEGYLDYDPDLAGKYELGKIRVKPLLVNWARAARMVPYKGKDLSKDYDAVRLVGNIKYSDLYDGTNEPPGATLAYGSKKLRFDGVPYFSYSDSQLVDVKPQDYKVFVLKDRNFDYGGYMRAGIIDLYGTGYDKYHFKYEDFKILCDSIDSLKFTPKRDVLFAKKYGNGNKLALALERLKIEGIKGAVYINKPENKSGKKPYYEYPVFDCYTQAHVYWDRIQGGVYQKKKLEFTLDPFVIDSLMTLDIRQLEFQGEFIPGEIMPSFLDTLKPVADNTYGIREVMPEGGVPLYGGKGQFHNEVIMDGYALHGNGQIDYLSTITKADTFVFHFDSVMSAHADVYMPAGPYNNVKYPELAAKNVKYTWYPKQDKLVLESQGDRSFDLFKGAASFMGKIIITPQGIHGDGQLKLGQMIIDSKDISFDELKFESKDTSTTFTVVDKDIDTKQHFKANNVKLQVDVETQHADFLYVPNLENMENPKPPMEFPSVRYQTTLAQGYYDKAQNEVVLKSSKIFAGEMSYYESTNPDQYGLKFVADSSRYNLDTQEIKIAGVDSILAGDAVIYPDSQRVVVEPTGKVRELSNARIVASYIKRYHYIFGATVNIGSRIYYKAAGKYSYPIQVNGQPQTIVFSNIATNPADTATVGSTKILEEEQFQITCRIFFRGTVKLDASQQFMTFEGEVKPQSRNTDLFKDWLKFSAVVNPDTIFIPFTLGTGVTAGTHYWPRYRTYYMNFMQKRRTPNEDKDVCLALGGISVDCNTSEFKIGPELKIKKQGQYKGNVATYDDSLQIYTTSGYFNIPFAKPQDNNVNIEFAGQMRENRYEKLITTDFLLALSILDFPKEAMDELKYKLSSVLALTEPINLDNDLLLESLAEFTDKNNTTEENIKAIAKDVKAGQGGNKVKTAKNVPATLLLSGVKFRYVQEPERGLYSFYSDQPIGLLGVGGESYNRQVNAKIEYRLGAVLPNLKTYDDTLRILLRFDEDNWLFFQYNGKEVKTGASFPNYNKQIQNIIAKQESDKKKPDDKTTRFKLISIDDVDLYEMRFIKTYLLKDETAPKPGGGFPAPIDSLPPDSIPGGGGTVPPDDGTPPSPGGETPAPGDGSAPGVPPSDGLPVPSDDKTVPKPGE